MRSKIEFAFQSCQHFLVSEKDAKSESYFLNFKRMCAKLFQHFSFLLFCFVLFYVTAISLGMTELGVLFQLEGDT